MTTVGTHSKPIDGAVTANGRVLVPWHTGHLEAEGRPVSALPRTAVDDPGQSVTIPDKPRWWRADGAMFIAIALFSVAQVAVVAFSGSWQHQYELSIHLRQAHWVAGMQPLSVEGLIVSATLVMWYAGRHRYRRREVWGAYLVLAAGVGQTVLMNLGADHPGQWPWLGPEVSVWPAVAFVAAYEMAVWLVRKRQDGGQAADDDRARSGQPGKNGGDGTGLAGSRPVKVAAVTAPLDKRVDKPGQPRTAMDKAAAAIVRHPGWTDTALAKSAGVSTKTIQRARNPKGRSTP